MTVDQAQRQTIQKLPDAANGNGAGSDFWYIPVSRGWILKTWGTRERERQLREYYRHEYNTLLQGAFGGLVKKIKATPWELAGPSRGRNTARYFQDVFRDADFGDGWGNFLSRVLLDYLRQDGGAYIEIIAPGNPKRAPTGAITGLAHLDSLRCFPTGDPEFPVVYYSRDGKMHLLHNTRVIHLVDMPDSDESHPGYGLCALSRAIAIVQRQILMGRYIEQSLDDKPRAGFLVMRNVNSSELTKILTRYQQRQGTDQRPPWGDAIEVFSTDPSQPVEVQFVTYSEPPEKFDYAAYVQVDVNELALALGVDKQELWELTGGGIGTGAQSAILHAKSQGKAYGEILASLERKLNDALPESCEFEFKQQDSQESREAAEIAGAWAGFTASVADNMTPDEKRQLLANQVEAVKDAITDENGEVIRLNDADVQPETEQVITDDTSPMPDAEQQPNTLATGDDAALLAVKAIASTRASFEADFAEALGLAQVNAVSERGYATLVRNLIREFGRKAYEDGLVEGGVADGALDDEDEAEVVALMAQQSGFVNDYAAAVYSTGLSEAEAALKPAMWFNKSIAVFYDSGRLSADKNGYYSFEGDDGAESCATCKRLKNQIHRMRDWTRKQMRPGIDTENYICGGWQCRHRLVKVEKAQARGTF